MEITSHYKKMFFCLNLRYFCLMKSALWHSKVLCVCTSRQSNHMVVVSRPSLTTLQQAKAYGGHSTTTWTKFYHLPPSSGQLWTFYTLNTYPLFSWPSVDFLMSTYLPLLVHIVFEWPLGMYQEAGSITSC